MTEFMPRVNWDRDETKELINIWADDVIQADLASSAHNALIYDTIAAELRRRNFNRTGLQCKQRITKLKYDYKRCCAELRKRKRNRSIKQCKYFKELHTIMQSTSSQERSIKLSESVDRNSSSNSPIAPSKSSIESRKHEITQRINSDKNTLVAPTTDDLARDNSQNIAFNLLQYEDATASLTETSRLKNHLKANDIINEPNGLKSSFSSLGQRNILISQHDCSHNSQNMPMMDVSFQEPYKMTHDDPRCKVAMMTDEAGMINAQDKGNDHNEEMMNIRTNRKLCTGISPMLSQPVSTTTANVTPEDNNFTGDKNNFLDENSCHNILKEDFMNMCKGYFHELIRLIEELHQREDRRIQLTVDYERDRQKREEMRFQDEKRYQETVTDFMKSIFHLLKSEINQR